MHKPNKQKLKHLDDDCICVESKTDCVIIDDDSNCDSGCVDLTSTQFQPSTSKKKRINNTATTSNIKIRENLFSQGNDFFFKDISKMSLYDNTIPRSETQISPLRSSKSETADVIIIDDSLINTTVNSVSGSTELDDSVVFVSSTSPDFIPLHNNTNSNNESNIYVGNAHLKNFSKNVINNSKISYNHNSPTSLKLNENVRNELFTQSEKKQLNKYNENAYNPNSGCEKLTDKRMIIIDGSNIAFSHSLNQKFSVKGLQICIEYFMKMGHEVKAVMPQFRLQRSKSSDPEALEKMHEEGKIVLTPCKNLPGKSSTSYDDRFILQLAYELDAVIVSNDNYRDLLNENPAFKKIIENRVIGYTWCNDIFLLPKDPYGKWGPTLQSILNRKL